MPSAVFVPEDVHHFHSTVARAMDVRSHFDVLVWLQGDMQRYLPHDIMVAAWGDFAAGAVQHDVISPLKDVRSKNSDAATITPVLIGLFNRWSEFGQVPFCLNSGPDGFLLQDSGLTCVVGAALQKMRSAMVHGIKDERGSHDCLYVTFSTRDVVEPKERSALALVLPYIDTALRQIEHLPHQTHQLRMEINANAPGVIALVAEHGLTDRELDILNWVTMGKTNPEIGSILDISAFTVKNHLKRVFKKLNVSNRAQAVGRFQGIVSSNAQ